MQTRTIVITSWRNGRHAFTRIGLVHTGTGSDYEQGVARRRKASRHLPFGRWHWVALEEGSQPARTRRQVSVSEREKGRCLAGFCFRVRGRRYVGFSFFFPPPCKMKAQGASGTKGIYSAAFVGLSELESDLVGRRVQGWRSRRS